MTEVTQDMMTVLKHLSEVEAENATLRAMLTDPDLVHIIEQRVANCAANSMVFSNDTYQRGDDRIRAAWRKKMDAAERVKSMLDSVAKKQTT